MEETNIDFLLNRLVDVEVLQQDADGSSGVLRISKSDGTAFIAHVSTNKA